VPAGKLQGHLTDADALLLTEFRSLFEAGPLFGIGRMPVRRPAIRQ